MADKVKKTAKPGMPDEKAAKEAAKATLLAMTKTDAQKSPAVKAPAAVEIKPASVAAVKAPASVAVKTPPGAAVKVEEKPVMVAPKVEAAAAKSEGQKPEAAKAKTVKASAPKTDVPKAEATKAETVKASAPKTDVPKAEAAKAETVKASAPKTVVPKTEAAKAEPVKAAATEDTPKAESKKEADPSKEFVDGIMTEMSLKGGSKKRLIKMLGEQFNFDKQKVMFRLKRALITERYAAAHAEAGH